MDIKRLREEAVIPTKADKGSAGYDLYAAMQTEVTIQPHTTAMIPTGWAMAISPRYVGLIYARSGLAARRALAPANCVGVVDPSYRGEVMVALHNYGTEPQTIYPGERIAQILFQEYAEVNFITVDELDETERGNGGFGHSGR